MSTMDTDDPASDGSGRPYLYGIEGLEPEDHPSWTNLEPLDFKVRLSTVRASLPLQGGEGSGWKVSWRKFVIRSSEGQRDGGSVTGEGGKGSVGTGTGDADADADTGRPTKRMRMSSNNASAAAAAVSFEPVGGSGQSTLRGQAFVDWSSRLDILRTDPIELGYKRIVEWNERLGGVDGMKGEEVGMGNGNGNGKGKGKGKGKLGPLLGYVRVEPIYEKANKVGSKPTGTEGPSSSSTTTTTTRTTGAPSTSKSSGDVTSASNQNSKKTATAIATATATTTPAAPTARRRGRPVAKGKGTLSENQKGKGKATDPVIIIDDDEPAPPPPANANAKPSGSKGDEDDFFFKGRSGASSSSSRNENSSRNLSEEHGGGSRGRKEHGDVLVLRGLKRELWLFNLEPDGSIEKGLVRQAPSPELDSVDEDREEQEKGQPTREAGLLPASLQEVASGDLSYLSLFPSSYFEPSEKPSPNSPTSPTRTRRGSKPPLSRLSTTTLPSVSETESLLSTKSASYISALDLVPDSEEVALAIDVFREAIRGDIARRSPTIVNDGGREGGSKSKRGYPYERILRCGNSVYHLCGDVFEGLPFRTPPVGTLSSSVEFDVSFEPESIRIWPFVRPSDLVTIPPLNYGNDHPISPIHKDLFPVCANPQLTCPPLPRIVENAPIKLCPTGDEASFVRLFGNKEAAWEASLQRPDNDPNRDYLRRLVEPELAEVHRLEPFFEEAARIWGMGEQWEKGRSKRLWVLCRLSSSGMENGPGLAGVDATSQAGREVIIWPADFCLVNEKDRSLLPPSDDVDVLTAGKPTSQQAGCGPNAPHQVRHPPVSDLDPATYRDPLDLACEQSSDCIEALTRERERERKEKADAIAAATTAATNPSMPNPVTQSPVTSTRVDSKSIQITKPVPFVVGTPISLDASTPAPSPADTNRSDAFQVGPSMLVSVPEPKLEPSAMYPSPPDVPQLQPSASSKSSSKAGSASRMNQTASLQAPQVLNDDMDVDWDDSTAVPQTAQGGTDWTGLQDEDFQMQTVFGGSEEMGDAIGDLTEDDFNFFDDKPGISDHGMYGMFGSPDEGFDVGDNSTRSDGTNALQGETIDGSVGGSIPPPQKDQSVDIIVDPLAPTSGPPPTEEGFSSGSDTSDRNSKLHSEVPMAVTPPPPPPQVDIFPAAPPSYDVQLVQAPKGASEMSSPQHGLSYLRLGEPAATFDPIPFADTSGLSSHRYLNGAMFAHLTLEETKPSSPLFSKHGGPWHDSILNPTLKHVRSQSRSMGPTKRTGPISLTVLIKSTGGTMGRPLKSNWTKSLVWDDESSSSEDDSDVFDDAPSLGSLPVVVSSKLIPFGIRGSSYPCSKRSEPLLEGLAFDTATFKRVAEQLLYNPDFRLSASLEAEARPIPTSDAYSISRSVGRTSRLLEHSNAPDMIDYISAPRIQLIQSDLLLELSMVGFRFWDKMAFEPIGGPKDVTAIVVLDVASRDFRAAASNWLESITEAYVGCRLGNHSPAKTDGHSVVTLREGDQGASLDALVSGLIEGGSIRGHLVIYRFQSDFSRSSLLRNKTDVLQSHAQVLVKTLPSSSIVTDIPPYRTWDSHQIWSDKFKRLAFSVYESIRLRVDTHLPILSFSGSRASTSSIPFVAPAFVLAAPEQVEPHFTTTWPPPTLDILNRHRFLHFCYALSSDGRCVFVASIDDRGEQYSHSAYRPGKIMSDLDAPSAVWKYVQAKVAESKTEWRISVARLGCMTRNEVEAWTSLLSSAVPIWTRPAHVSLLSVDISPPITLLRTYGESVAEAQALLRRAAEGSEVASPTIGVSDQKTTDKSSPVMPMEDLTSTMHAFYPPAPVFLPIPENYTSQGRTGHVLVPASAFLFNVPRHANSSCPSQEPIFPRLPQPSRTSISGIGIHVLVAFATSTSSLSISLTRHVRDLTQNFSDLAALARNRFCMEDWGPTPLHVIFVGLLKDFFRDHH